MSHIQSHHGGTDEHHNTYLVILKVHGEAIHVWNQSMDRLSQTHSLKIYCHNVEQTSTSESADQQVNGKSKIQTFVLSEPSVYKEACKFKHQTKNGQTINKSDLITFMTNPVDSSERASYAIDLNLSRKHFNHTSTMENNNLNNNATEEDDDDDDDEENQNCERIGTAFVYLDPKFSSQGIQRTPIIARNHMPIGQIQIEYLIVTNPIAHGKPAIKPSWLYTTKMDAGHRGAGSGRRLDLPDELMENTIASFNYAHRHGAAMCELDVLVSADGVPVVYHDFDVDAVAAQQSRDQLGKFRVQVNEFTVKQMRDFRLLSLHDEEGCPYTLNVPNQAETNKPFPTLEQVLKEVDESCGLNIEIKWPQLLESGKMEARKYREINDFVDRIIDVISRNAGDRRIVVESFDADLVILLRLKQDQFPVVFLSQGMTDRYERYMDLRARSVKNGIYFAQAFDLAGIDLILDYFMMSGKKLVDFIINHDLVARTWGDFDDDLEKLSFLRNIGIQCITYDRIDLIKQQQLQQQQLLSVLRDDNVDRVDDNGSYYQENKTNQTQVYHHHHKSSIVDDNFDDYERILDTKNNDSFYLEEQQQSALFA